MHEKEGGDIWSSVSICKLWICFRILLHCFPPLEHEFCSIRTAEFSECWVWDNTNSLGCGFRRTSGKTLWLEVSSCFLKEQRLPCLVGLLGGGSNRLVYIDKQIRKLKTEKVLWTLESNRPGIKAYLCCFCALQSWANPASLFYKYEWYITSSLDWGFTCAYMPTCMCARVRSSPIGNT